MPVSVSWMDGMMGPGARRWLSVQYLVASNGSCSTSPCTASFNLSYERAPAGLGRWAAH
jgi:hypothetical protein